VLPQLSVQRRRLRLGCRLQFVAQPLLEMLDDLNAAAASGDVSAISVDSTYASRSVGFAVGLAYWYDKYRVDDFALSPVASLAQPATATPTLMLLGYFYRPYTANTVVGRVTVFW